MKAYCVALARPLITCGETAFDTFVPDPVVTVEPCSQYRLYEVAPVTVAQPTDACWAPPVAPTLVGVAGGVKV